MLTHEEIRRYSRHLIMPEVGRDGQERLKAARVLLVGAGGLGSPLSLYLTAAGVGTIGLLDDDVVDESNLQRQVLYTTCDVGRSKVDVAAERLSALNPGVALERHPERLTSANALRILAGYHVVVDGSDNFPTRYLVNDACVLLRKPNVYGSIFRFEGQASVFDASVGPCYRCLYPEPPPPGAVPSCAEGGVLGVLPGLVGLIQAIETIKLLLRRGDTLVGRLVLVDALAMRFRELHVKKSPVCPICGPERTITELIDYEQFCGVEAEHPSNGGAMEVSPRQLKAEIDGGKQVRIVDVREPMEYQIVHIPGSELIPLRDLPRKVGTLGAAEEIVVHCHHGMRSAEAQAYLLSLGFTKVRNLSGGIDRWATEVDPAMPRY
jgi:adenylyltransferase/sulfurtransferase